MNIETIDDVVDVLNQLENKIKKLQQSKELNIDEIRLLKIYEYADRYTMFNKTNNEQDKLACLKIAKNYVELKEV